jgi:hypothetical protein
MRLAIAAFILSLAVPSADAASKQAKCRKTCDSNYGFCMNRATTKQMKKSCKSDHKGCRVTCK